MSTPESQKSSPQSPLEQLAEALRAEKEAPVESETAPVSKTKVVKPKALADIAKSLALQDADLYAVEVPSAVEGADPYTIGKLKDLAREHDDFAVKQIRAEDELRRKRAEVARSEEDLREIFASLPADAIKPEKLAALKERRNRALTLEGQRLLEAVPEWRDAQLRAQELDAMVEHLKDSGFSADYLTGVHDYKTLQYIRNNWLRERQIRAALEKVTERKSITPPKAKPGIAPRPKVNGSAPASHEQQQVARFIAQISKHAQ